MVLCRRAERAEWMDNSSVRERVMERGKMKGGWVLLWRRALRRAQ